MVCYQILRGIRLPVREFFLNSRSRRTAREAQLPTGAASEVLVAVVDGFELAAINGDARLGEKPHLAAELDKARAHLAQRRTVVLAEVGDCFVVRDQSAQQPHYLYVTASFALQPPARLNPVKIAVDVELQQH